MFRTGLALFAMSIPCAGISGEGPGPEEVLSRHSVGPNQEISVIVSRAEQEDVVRFRNESKREVALFQMNSELHQYIQPDSRFAVSCEPLEGQLEALISIGGTEYRDYIDVACGYLVTVVYQE